MVFFFQTRLSRAFPGKEKAILRCFTPFRFALTPPWWMGTILISQEIGQRPSKNGQPAQPIRRELKLADHYLPATIPLDFNRRHGQELSVVLDSLCLALCSRRGRSTQQYEALKSLLQTKMQQTAYGFQRYLDGYNVRFPQGFTQMLGKNLSYLLLAQAWFEAVGEEDDRGLRLLLELFKRGTPVVFSDTNLEWLTLFTLPAQA